MRRPRFVHAPVLRARANLRLLAVRLASALASALTAWAMPRVASSAPEPAQTPVGEAPSAQAIVQVQAPAQPTAAAPGTRVVTLAELERLAVARQPQILIARAATSTAEAQSEQSRSVLFPQVTGTASYTRRSLRSAPGSPSVNSSGSYDIWNFGIGATQLLYDFNQTIDRFESAQSNADAARYQERTTRLQILSALRRAYFNARATKELVDVARDTLDDQNKHLTQVQGFVGVGTQPPIALAQQRALVANAQVQLIVAQNNYETAKAQLNQAAGVPEGTDYDVADAESAVIEDEDQPLETLVAKALVARPEMQSLDKQREAQKYALGSARGGYGPALSASGNASEQGTALDGLGLVWNAGVALTWPIFQGGLTTAQIHQAQAGLESIDAQRSLEALQVRLDVDAARLAVRAAKATIGAAEDAVSSAHEQLRLAEQRYATGVGSIIELADAQVAYSSAAAQVVQARYGLASARAQLLAALGRT